MDTLPPPEGESAPPPTPDAIAPPVIPPVGPAETTIQTENERLSDGITRCPSCGATDVQLRPATGTLICLFCRHEWSEGRLDEHIETGDIHLLQGVHVGSGAADIDDGAATLMTLKCGGCGAEVVINLTEQVASRCHWCRHTLTINEQIPNGAVPDAVLPFSITHEQAVEAIRAFAGKRRTFADRGFVRDFSPENVVGVYMPYMVIDANASASVAGVGEVETRRYTRGSGDDQETFYDADVYAVERHVTFTTDDLTIEASAERATMNSTNTNNIINTILPFDTENAVRWNANYLNGFTSERRDLDVAHRTPVVEDQLLSIARSQVAPSTSAYGRGVRWEHERLQVHGVRWLAMCLPVWLYSHHHEKGGKAMVHYIAVNGRTGEVMGSVPVSHARLAVAALVTGTFLEGLVIALLAAGS